MFCCIGGGFERLMLVALVIRPEKFKIRIQRSKETLISTLTQTKKHFCINIFPFTEAVNTRLSQLWYVLYIVHIYRKFGSLLGLLVCPRASKT